MSNVHLIYEENNGFGEFIGHLICPADTLEQNKALLSDSQGLFEYAEDLLNISDYYFDMINTKRVRPDMPGSENSTKIRANNPFIITGLPVDCVITITDTDIETDDIIITAGEDQEVGFTTAVPGKYTVTARLFPYKDKTWEVIVA